MFYTLILNLQVLPGLILDKAYEVAIVDWESKRENAPFLQSSMYKKYIGLVTEYPLSKAEVWRFQSIRTSVLVKPE